jgi:hypothetical protein
LAKIHSLKEKEIFFFSGEDSFNKRERDILSSGKDSFSKRKGDILFSGEEPVTKNRR